MPTIEYLQLMSHVHSPKQELRLSYTSFKLSAEWYPTSHFRYDLIRRVVFLAELGPVYLHGPRSARYKEGISGPAIVSTSTVEE